MRSFFLAFALAAGLASAGQMNPCTDWFRDAKYGVFTHYVSYVQNNPAKLQSLGLHTSWDECVNAFDAERYARDVAACGAGYVIFTAIQNDRFMVTPNATFEKLTGYAPGEACSTRDLVEDLYQALHKRGIPLLLYWTGNGPTSDPRSVAKLGWTAPVNKAWVEKWAAVTEECSRRYGKKIAGWWVDGCYREPGNFQYDDEKLGILAKAFKAGNPDAIIALNPGVAISAYSRHEDFTAGEQNRFEAVPEGRWLNGEQWHVLSFLGHSRPDNNLAAGWCEPGVQYAPEELADYIFQVNRQGGVVSVDMALFRDGALDRAQVETMRRVRGLLAERSARAERNKANLAFFKPARILSQDGNRSLPDHDGLPKHTVRSGVDGDPATTAWASGEWPWAYEIDLTSVQTFGRIAATFGRDYFPTRVRASVSSDRKNWDALDERALTGGGQTAEWKFAPRQGRYIRVTAVKPDGPDQPGYQMSISEIWIE